MQEPPTWRDLLGSIIQDPHERQRIANELGVNPVTLMRWVHNEATPRQQNLQLLFKALPQHQTVLRELIAEEFSLESVRDSIAKSNDEASNRQLR